MRLSLRDLSAWMTQAVASSKWPLWPVLVAVFPCFFWVQVHFYPPWPNFHKEAGMYLFFSVACLVIWVIRIRPYEWTWPPVIALSLAFVCWLQFFAGLIPSVAQALLASSLFAAVALVWVTARSVTLQHRYVVADILFLSIASASILNVGSALYQALGLQPNDYLSGMGVWVMNIDSGQRPVGNVAQPNEMATLLAWGLVAGLWAWRRGLISLSTWLFYGLFLALGLGLCHSRIGLVHSAVLLGLVFIFRSKLGGWKATAFMLAVVSFHYLLFFSLPTLSDLFHLNYRGRNLDTVAVDQPRLQIYAMSLHAISQSPWIGYGTATLTMAQWVVGGDFRPLNALLAQAHNWMLDLLLWFGIPIGTMLIALIYRWIYCVACQVRRSENFLLAFPLVIFGLHASVELPHWAAQFLLTATAFAGCLCAENISKGLISSKWISGVLAAILAPACFLTLLDYARYERNFVQFRAEQLGVLKEVSEVPNSWVLFHLADMLRMSRMNALPNLQSEDLAWMEKTVIALPYQHNVFTYAVSLALNDRQSEAIVWMQRLDSSSAPNYRAVYRRYWKKYQSWYPQIIGNMDWPQVLNESKQARHE